MSNNILYTVGTPIVVADVTDYSPAAATTLGTRTDQIDVTDLAAANARQSAKLDFTATRAPIYDVRMTFELATDPAAGGSIALYMSPSQSGTANVGNMGLCTGADAAYAAAGGYTLAELLTHLHFLGTVPTAIQNDADGVQIAHVGLFAPTARYGCLVVVNNCSVAFHSDAVEFAVLFEPIIPQIQ